jgi:MFS transporter, DHA3 family, macrolide efflux protein
MGIEKAETALLKSQSVFLNRNFMFLISGKIISQLWDQIYAFALSWYILDITKSSLQMAVFLVINYLMGAIISPFGGIIADRFNRKGIMIWMDAIRGCVVLIVTILLYQHMMQIWMLYMSAMVLGFCGAIFSPAASAIIPNIVEESQLIQTSSMDQFIWSFCCMVGMLISGILYNLIGITTIFLLNALSYFISGIMEACVNLPLKKYNNSINKNCFTVPEFYKIFKELNEGFQYVRKNRIIYYLMLMNAMIHLTVFPLLNVFFPYLFNVILKAAPFQLALTQSAGWIGMMNGTFLVKLFSNHYKLKNSIFWGLTIFGFCILLVSFMLFPGLRGCFGNWGITIVFSIIGLIIGVALIFLLVPINLIFQKYTLNEYRGRFWGLQSSVITLAMATGYLIGGFLAQKIQIQFLFLSTALVVFIIDLWTLSLKEIKGLKD